MGTLLAFTTVAISILILRYVPPDEVPLTSLLQESIYPEAFHHSQEKDGACSKDSSSIMNDGEISAVKPLINKEINQGNADNIPLVQIKRFDNHDLPLVSEWIFPVHLCFINGELCSLSFGQRN